MTWICPKCKKVDEFPVYRIVPISKNRLVHCVMLDNPDQVDEKLVGLLKESYELISK